MVPNELDDVHVESSMAMIHLKVGLMSSLNLNKKQRKPIFVE